MPTHTLAGRSPQQVYQVLKLRGLWHVHIPGPGRGVHPSEEKSHMVDWACEQASRVDGIVHVRDGGGKIETIYDYRNGVRHETTPA